MSASPKDKPFPKVDSAKAVDAVLKEDLSAYDWSDMKPTAFEFAAKDARVNMRLPKALLEQIKAQAAKQGMPYQRFIRKALEGALGG